MFYNGSVETIGDECNQVGVSLPHIEVQSIRKDEEIVHSFDMENQKVSDKAFVQLAMRSGQFQTINVRDVREGEVLGEDFVSGEMQFKKLPDEARDKAAIVGYVGFFRLVNGFQKMMYWTVGQLQEHGKKYSKTYSNGQWQQNFDAMARKTVLKLLLSKYAPLSVEMQTAVKYDQSVIVNENGDKVYVDNPQNDNVVKAEVVDSSNPKDDSEAAAAEILKK